MKQNNKREEIRLEEFQMLWEAMTEGESSKTLLFIAFVISNVVTGIASRTTSKDKNKSEILTKAMQRQSELDTHQKQLFEQLNGEIKRLREEIEQSKEDAKEREENNMQLFDKNQQLLAKIGDLELSLERKEFECQRLKEKYHQD